MKKQGIRFILKDGTDDFYDPLTFNDFSETETEYVLDMAYTYKIPKEDVISFEWFDICQKCGYELFSDGCRNCKK